MQINYKYLSVLLFAATLNTNLWAQKNTPIEVWPDKPVMNIQSNMWGIFFEDINFGADGGLYAELVKNRSFEFQNPLMGWKKEGKKGDVLIVNRMPEFPNNPRYAEVKTDSLFSLTNEGFRGIGVKEGAQYDFSIMGQAGSGATLRIKVQLVGPKNEVLGETLLPAFHPRWAKYTASLKASKTETKANLRIVFEGHGSVHFDLVSLFPKDTWKGRPGGLRKDLVQMLADLKPGFLRFPGGCIVEGGDLSKRYQWKETVGDPDGRKVMINRWNTEFSYRAAADYYQTFGLGFYEYFQLAEDIGAKALPILNCGMACQYNTAEVVAITELDPYIQDALDLIEFANGDMNSKWGKLRAEMGHPKPFNLDRIGIGNEQWGPQYLERYKLFESALKRQYPGIKLVAAAGPSASGSSFDLAWKEFPNTKADLIDEHYYLGADWFLKNAKRYDGYSRKGPKIFAGEYAVHDKEGKLAESKNTWLSALAEAAFMTGLERNADVVNMAAYAPLLAHVEAWQWRPDLIWFDNLRVVATPNYYVQKMYSNYKGTSTVSIRKDNGVIAGKDSLYASAVLDQVKHQVILKVVNASGKAIQQPVSLNSTKKLTVKAEFVLLHNKSLTQINTLEEPSGVVPVVSSLIVKNNKAMLPLPPYSFAVIIIPQYYETKN